MPFLDRQWHTSHILSYELHYSNGVLQGIRVGTNKPVLSCYSVSCLSIHLTVPNGLSKCFDDAHSEFVFLGDESIYANGKCLGVFIFILQRP